MNRAPALIAAAIVAAVLAGCSSGPPPVKSHGTITLMANPLGGDPVSEAYPDVTDGSQVIITDSSGKVIGTGTLSPDIGQESVLRQMTAASLKVDADLLAPDIVVYQFAVTVPGGLDRYGVKVGQNRGTIYETAKEMKNGPSLTLGSLSG